MKRPLLWAAVAYAGGVWTGSTLSQSSLWLGAATLILGLYALLARPRRAWRDAVAVAGIFFGLGIGLCVVHGKGDAEDALGAYVRNHPGESCVLGGVVRDAPLPDPDAEYLQFTLDVDEAAVADGTRALKGKVRVGWRDPGFMPVPGQRVEVRGTPDAAMGSVNFGVWGLEDYLRSRGAYSSIDVRGAAVREITPAGFSFAGVIYEVRAWEAGLLRKAVPPEALDFAEAVWLGDRQGLDTEDRAAFLRSGTAHILAVSGVHCAIVFFASNALLGFFVKTRKRRAPLTMFLVLLFAFAAGARISTLRAAVMFLFYLLADCFGRERDAPTALGAAGLLFLGISPGLLFDTGFLLSFTSVASLMLFAEPIMARFPGSSQHLLRPASAALSVQILPLPLAAHFFHVLPWCAPLINIVVVPLLGLVLWLCLATMICGLALPSAAPLFGHALAPVVAVIEYIATSAASLRATYLFVASPSGVAMLCYWSAAALGAAVLHAKIPARRGLSAAAILLACSVAFWRPWFPPATVDWIDVGHGDAIFIRTPGGETLLVDGGNRNAYGDAGARYVLPFLYAQGVTRLDCVVATHPDSDHLGGLLSVVDAMPVGQAILGPESPGQPLEEEFLALCAARGVPVARVTAGARIELAGMTIRVLNPPREVGEWKDNDRSLVLYLDWPPGGVLLPGDIEARGEEFIAQQDCAAYVAMVPHHGSATSSSDTYLDATAPSHAVVSTARSRGRNPTGAGVLERYAGRGIQVWRTDQMGGLRLRNAGGVLTMESARRARGYDLIPDNRE